MWAGEKIKHMEFLCSEYLPTVDNGSLPERENFQKGQ